jgi:hypothetical protein
MPQCAGRPDGSDPCDKCDESVKSFNDMWLCDNCVMKRSATANSVSDNESIAVTLKDDTSLQRRNVTEDLTCELLCFLQQRSSIMSCDDLVQVCADFYLIDEINKAYTLLSHHVSGRIKKPKGGSDKEKARKLILIFVKSILDPSNKLPTFNAVNISRLPPVGIDHFDVSTLMQELVLLRNEVRSISLLRSEMGDMKSSLQLLKDSVVKRPNDMFTSAGEAYPQLVSQSVLCAGGSRIESATNSSKLAGSPSFSKVVGSKPNISTTLKKDTVKKPSLSRAVVGCSTSTSEPKLKSVITRRQVDLFVSRLQPDTETTDLQLFVKDLLGEVSGDVACNKLNSKYPDLYASCHISVLIAAEDMTRILDILYDADSWPGGVLVRRFFKPKNG